MINFRRLRHKLLRWFDDPFWAELRQVKRVAEEMRTNRSEDMRDFASLTITSRATTDGPDKKKTRGKTSTCGLLTDKGPDNWPDDAT